MARCCPASWAASAASVCSTLQRHYKDALLAGQLARLLLGCGVALRGARLLLRRLLLWLCRGLLLGRGLLLAGGACGGGRVGGRGVDVQRQGVTV